MKSCIFPGQVDEYRAHLVNGLRCEQGFLEPEALCKYPAEPGQELKILLVLIRGRDRTYYEMDRLIVYAHEIDPLSEPYEADYQVLWLHCPDMGDRKALPYRGRGPFFTVQKVTEKL